MWKYEIRVARVIAVEVVIPLEVFIGITGLPVTRRLDTVFKRSVVQYRKIKAATIPRHEIGNIPIDAVKKATHELRLVGIFIAC